MVFSSFQWRRFAAGAAGTPPSSLAGSADLPASAQAGLPVGLQPGTLVRLTGVCASQGNQRRDPKWFQILLRPAEDVAILQTVPWWTPERAKVGFGIARDVTARKRAEEARLGTERKYPAIFENAVEGMFQSSADGRLLSVNPALARMCGYDSPEQTLSEMLEQVIMNLAVNARDAMPNGGQLNFLTSVVCLNAQQLLENPEADPGEYVCLSVTDTGCGMDAATLAHVFEPFFTTKDVGKGTGRGLATVYGIVKQHKGRVEVTSQVGQGTTLRIYLPALREDEDTAPAAATHETPVVRRRETVLLVEDEPALRRLSQRVLVKHGFRVLEAATGAEALEVWSRQDARIHVLVTDMVMPGGITGGALARRLQAEDPALRVLYTSGYSVEMVGADSHLKEGGNFLQKPYLPAALVNAVLECSNIPENAGHTTFLRRA